MLNLLKALRQDEHGVILSTEIVIVGSLLVIGLITGLACLQKSVNGELQDLAGAIGALDQSYSFSSFRKAGTYGRCCAYTAGSSYSNCEVNTEKRGDIVGCSETYQVQASACGTCGGVATNGCSACGVSPCATAPCGTAPCGSAPCGSAPCGKAPCGSAPCGSAPCGKAPCGSAYGARVIDTGVPRMKVTEMPLSPRQEIVAPMVAPAPNCQDCTSTQTVPGTTSHEVIVVPSQPGVPATPAVPASPAPQPTPATPLTPVPEAQNLPPQA